ncbi:tryptophan synthase subunit alpha [Pelotomaculum propionicicum]|uniref:Tryptophan synthase alpha chain n=1 Tax=Pelotomaculum propionicicum TaxID=258475 RepID=A0A4Y7RSV1_9FIRM|nr:tryptophan synthase subunit alpha [Pelotomaculum propionicicum]NLI11909.1 tryptophan synthase subunit alpha [Peptococcaceae bacterium]TEB11809.1 Tryptophan synthase alpha chain [Pelotomaculum propionicicum]
MRGESRITACLEKLRRAGKKGLITFITAGDPDLAGTVVIAKHLAAAGADIIELGIPYSDPLADGPVIQQASARAIAAGTTIDKIFGAVGEIRQHCSVPIVLMGYYNPVYKYGVGKFAGNAAATGVNGLIIPDLPHEESGPLRREAAKAGLDLIPLVAPTTTEHRLVKIASDARGFIYCVSVTGVTGVREEIKTDLAAFTSRVRRFANLPLAVGFGIAGPEQAARAAVYCDAVVVGSALVKIIAGSRDAGAAGPAAGALVRSMKNMLDTA